MMRLTLLILTIVLCACSQSVQITQPPTKPPSHITTDTIDFGTDPLWRETDTTVWVNLASHNAITAIFISDSNFTLLDTSRTNDSLRISLRFQPQAIANHSGLCLLLSKQDTLARLTLLGIASPFERRVGDSYVFENESGHLDSFWISSLPLTISNSDNTIADVDHFFLSAHQWGDGDWASGLFDTIPVATLRFCSKGQQTGDPNSSIWNYHLSTGNVLGDSLYAPAHLQTKILSCYAEWDYSLGRSKYYFREYLDGLFAPDIGFFVTIRISTYSVNTGERCVLLRFHLRR